MSIDLGRGDLVAGDGAGFVTGTAVGVGTASEKRPGYSSLGALLPSAPYKKKSPTFERPGILDPNAHERFISFLFGCAGLMPARVDRTVPLPFDSALFRCFAGHRSYQIKYIAHCSHANKKTAGNRARERLSVGKAVRAALSLDS